MTFYESATGWGNFRGRLELDEVTATGLFTYQMHVLCPLIVLIFDNMTMSKQQLENVRQPRKFKDSLILRIVADKPYKCIEEAFLIVNSQIQFTGFYDEMFPNDTQRTIRFEFQITVKDDQQYIGNEEWIGAAIEIGDTQIWAGQIKIQLINKTDQNLTLVSTSRRAVQNYLWKLKLKSITESLFILLFSL